jgi:hypothetical protein
MGCLNRPKRLLRLSKTIAENILQAAETRMEQRIKYFTEHTFPLTKDMVMVKPSSLLPLVKPNFLKYNKKLLRHVTESTFSSQFNYIKGCSIKHA